MNILREKGVLLFAKPALKRFWQGAVVLQNITVLGLFWSVLTYAGTPEARAEASGIRYFNIAEYEVKGAKELSRLEVETAVYPYLGPSRTSEDVEKARAALEQAYREKGFEAASVQIPAQPTNSGVIVLQVFEGEIGRLRVRGAAYSAPSEIKKQAQSLKEGQVINFKKFSRDVAALNQQADRRVTPQLQTGRDPGKVDVDLVVQDSLPFHGALELNNRYSSGTTPLRLNGSMSYQNLWQLGHTIGASAEISPQNVEEVKVFSGYYLAPVPGVTGLSVMLQGTKQDSNVSVLGGTTSVGKGETVGPRVIYTLPGDRDFYHSITTGIDYKRQDQTLQIGSSKIITPITYFPISLNYNSTWSGPGYTTEFNPGVNFLPRGLGDDPANFGNKRFKSSGSYLYARGDLSHKHDLPAGLQAFGKIQGQISGVPLIDTEQFSAGGLNTVRGYLESEALGDNAMAGTFELRSPSLSTWLGKTVDEWRFYVFADGAMVTLNDALPEQQSRFDLASYGVGSRLRLFDHVNGSFDLGVPLIKTTSNTRDLLLTFRLSADF